MNLFGEEEKSNEYLVLARKYRPKTFSELIGQEALVKTLTNAINTGRVAHAFVLTGIRGVGKTTTARIIAKALNCLGIDGKGGGAPEPCGKCENCVSISEDRNVDVIETDAASRTGVNDIREIIDNVHYAPVSCRYKIYIIDEVHMLSKNAFNALLKTLEEPPPHVKFIFATTEVRKIPITILSRCQRFDLTRVSHDVISKRLKEVSEKEGFVIEEAAAKMIAKASEGSVRDSLSILDQALSTLTGEVKRDDIAKMLGLSDHSRIFDIFEALASSDVAKSLEVFKELYNLGSEPVTVLEDLLELTHFIAVKKVSPNAEVDSQIGESDSARALEISSKFSAPFLIRFWQVLTKGVGEVKFSSNQYNAAEMVLIKLGFISNEPTPDDLIKKIKSGEISVSEKAKTEEVKEKESELVLMKKTVSENQPPIHINSFSELVQKLSDAGEMFLYNWLTSSVNLVSFEQGRLEFRQSSEAPKDLAARINKLLNDWTGKRWVVALSNENGEKTIKEVLEVETKKLISEAEKNEIVKAVLENFPGAKISSVKREENFLSNQLKTMGEAE